MVPSNSHQRARVHAQTHHTPTQTHVVEVGGEEDGGSILDGDGRQHAVLAHALEPLDAEAVRRLSVCSMIGALVD